MPARLFRNPGLRACGGALFCAAILQGLIVWGGFRVNISSSIPPGLYREAPASAPERGELILSCLPEPWARLAAERGYTGRSTGRGSCSSGTLPVGKYLAALPGDCVSISAAGMQVNGTLLPLSAPLSRDGRGRPLPDRKWSGCLGTDEYLLYSVTASGFDSRYFGPVNAKYFISALRPLLTSKSG